MIKKPKNNTTQIKKSTSNRKPAKPKPKQENKNPKNNIKEKPNYEAMINEFKRVEPTSELIWTAIKTEIMRPDYNPLIYMTILISFCISAIAYYSNDAIHVLHTASTIATITLIIIHLITQMCYLNMTKTITPYMLKKLTKPTNQRTKSVLKKQFTYYESAIILQAITGFTSIILSIITLYSPTITQETKSYIAILSVIYLYPTIQTIINFKTVIRRTIAWQRSEIAYKYTELKDRNY